MRWSGRRRRERRGVVGVIVLKETIAGGSIMETHGIIGGRESAMETRDVDVIAVETVTAESTTTKKVTASIGEGRKRRGTGSESQTEMNGMAVVTDAVTENMMMARSVVVIGTAMTVTGIEIGTVILDVSEREVIGDSTVVENRYPDCN